MPRKINVSRPDPLGLAAVIPNFCEAVKGEKPDMGAHDRGMAKMEFGLKARFTPF
jgi:hypothetical protein